jgi:hypothetical protein
MERLSYVSENRVLLTLFTNREGVFSATHFTVSAKTTGKHSVNLGYSKS